MANKKCFGIYVQYIASALLDPDFEAAVQNDLYFQTACSHVQRSIDAWKESVLDSSVWPTPFRLALEARPFHLPGTVVTKVDACSACCKSAADSVALRLLGPEWTADPGGRSFHRLGLLEVGRPAVSLEEPPYFVGRGCLLRTALYHALHHFPFHLLQAVKQWVRDRPLPSAAEDAAVVVNELLDDTAWLRKQFHEYRRLLAEAETRYCGPGGGAAPSGRRERRAAVGHAAGQQRLTDLLPRKRPKAALSSDAPGADEISDSTDESDSDSTDTSSSSSATASPPRKKCAGSSRASPAATQPARGAPPAPQVQTSIASFFRRK